MMTNLFSIFDPSSSLPFMTNWVSLIFWLALLPSSMYLLSSPGLILYNSISSKVAYEMSAILSPKDKPTILMFCALFGIIMTTNLMGLLPFVFTPTSHLLITVIWAVPLWATFMLVAILTSTTNLLAHLVPVGTPGLLIPLMVVIETLSLFIRPAALAVRLAANMIAGHLLLTLLGSYGTIFNFTTSVAVISSSLLLTTLELAVAVIQAYVFTILLTLYASEAHV